jgi:hypothetical protein
MGMDRNVRAEALFSEWTIKGIDRRDNTTGEANRWMNKILWRPNDTAGQISWIAGKLKDVKAGASIDPEGLGCVMLMLGSRSITVSECAKDILVLLYAREPEEVKERLLAVLEGEGNGEWIELVARKNAIEVLARVGEEDAAEIILRNIGDFKKEEDRAWAAGKVAGLARENEVCLKRIRGILEEQAAKVEGANGEFAGYYRRIREAQARRSMDIGHTPRKLKPPARKRMKRPKAPSRNSRSSRQRNGVS